MRNLIRNQQPIFYRLYKGEEEIVDQYGNSTGQMLPIYSDLKSAMLCVSPNKGTSETEQFGSFEQYDRTMTTADANCEIDENAVLWVDNADTDGPWNYIVKAVGRWKNSAQYAIQKVTVSQYKAVQEQIDNGLSAKTKAINADLPESDDNAEDITESA